jgi:hypothetical protein
VPSLLSCRMREAFTPVVDLLGFDPSRIPDDLE